jgi:PST family polysaccharide transporter
LLTSWWFARKVVIADIEVSWAHAIAEAKKLLGFGLPIMATALQGVCVAYFLRLIIANQFGLAGVGVWSAAFAVSGILVNFVLNAMGTDYYPRLASVALNNALIEKEVNAQLEIALLLALPALLATVLFAPIGIELLYSGKFNDAIPILRWSVYGIFGRVISWPLSYIIIAQGRGKFFCAAELLANLAHVLLIYTCSKLWGLPGTGIGFMILYIYYFVFMVVTAHFIAKTHFSLGNLKLILNSIFLLVFASCMHIFIQNHFVYYANSFALSLVVIWVVLRRISRLTGVTLNGFKARFKR